MRAEHQKIIRSVGDDMQGDIILEKSLTCLSAEKHHFIQTFCPILANMELRTNRTNPSNFKSVTVIYLMHIYHHFLKLRNILPNPCETSSSQFHDLKGIFKVEKCQNFTFQSGQNETSISSNWKYIVLIFRKRHTGGITRRLFFDSGYISWDTGMRLCRTVGASLPVFENMEEYHFFLAFLKLSHHVRYTEGLFVHLLTVVSETLDMGLLCHCPSE